MFCLLSVVAGWGRVEASQPSGQSTLCIGQPRSWIPNPTLVSWDACNLAYCRGCILDCDLPHVGDRYHDMDVCTDLASVLFQVAYIAQHSMHHLEANLTLTPITYIQDRFFKVPSLPRPPAHTLEPDFQVHIPSLQDASKQHHTLLIPNPSALSHSRMQQHLQDERGCESAMRGWQGRDKELSKMSTMKLTEEEEVLRRKKGNIYAVRAPSASQSSLL